MRRHRFALVLVSLFLTGLIVIGVGARRLIETRHALEKWNSVKDKLQHAIDEVERDGVELLESHVRMAAQGDCLIKKHLDKSRSGRLVFSYNWRYSSRSGLFGVSEWMRGIVMSIHCRVEGPAGEPEVSLCRAVVLTVKSSRHGMSDEKGVIVEVIDYQTPQNQLILDLLQKKIESLDVKCELRIVRKSRE